MDDIHRPCIFTVIKEQKPAYSHINTCLLCKCYPQIVTNTYINLWICDQCIIARKNSPSRMNWRPSSKLIVVRGQNVQRDTITMSKSTSPYAKKITIKYQSPKKRIYTYDNFNQNNPEFYAKNPQLHRTTSTFQGEPDIRRPKILDRKKLKEKQRKMFVTFKSVKSASTATHIQTPQKLTYSGQKEDRERTTHIKDENFSPKSSLSRISIDQRVFQQ